MILTGKQEIDDSMMEIELTDSKQPIWVYRAIYGFDRCIARQHLLARRTNPSEIISLNDQTTTTNKGKFFEQLNNQLME
ncbi:unnamed protein product [Rotaria sordida]|uniref:Uncharacterized protein n=1 Tax=Rotaria sordida TaxID=392033 RepID=A0A818SUG6_9BILA|nr:unnamed protein product [Rotaria sordida]